MSYDDKKPCEADPLISSTDEWPRAKRLLWAGMSLMIGLEMVGFLGLLWTKNPLWIAVAFVGAIPGIALIAMSGRLQRRVLTALEGRFCTRCGYDLRHAPERGVCIECGAGYSFEANRWLFGRGAKSTSKPPRG